MNTSWLSVQRDMLRAKLPELHSRPGGLARAIVPRHADGRHYGDASSLRRVDGHTKVFAALTVAASSMAHAASSAGRETAQLERSRRDTGEGRVPSPVRRRMFTGRKIALRSKRSPMARPCLWVLGRWPWTSSGAAPRARAHAAWAEFSSGLRGLGVDDSARQSPALFRKRASRRSSTDHAPLSFPCSLQQRNGMRRDHAEASRVITPSTQAIQR